MKSSTIKLKALALCITSLSTSTAFGFAEDLCYQLIDKRYRLYNCFVMPDICKSDQIPASNFTQCKAISAVEALTAGRRVANRHLDGGRSLLHLDTTYYLAQLIGFSAKDAYQMAIYNQAADTGFYIPRDQDGNSLLTPSELDNCKSNRKASKKCLLTTPSLNGLIRTNRATGGVLLHLGARFADKPTPPLTYPVNYLETPALEPIILNAKDWAYGKRDTLCVSGLTNEKNCITSTEGTSIFINGYYPIFEPGKSQRLSLHAELGDIIIQNEFDTNGSIIPSSIVYSHQFDDYVKPNDPGYAKFGIYLHSLQDRYSHHKCYDNSYITKDQNSPNYHVYFDIKICDQGEHTLSHSWEVGMPQSQLSNTINMTLEPAVSITFDELVAYAKYRSIAIRKNLNKELIIRELMTRLEIADPNQRIDAVVLLLEQHGLRPLPKHGTNTDLTTSWIE